MSVFVEAEEFYAPVAHLKSGMLVRYREKGTPAKPDGREGYGIVLFIWPSLDTPAVKVLVDGDNGATTTLDLLPELGDEVTAA